MSRTAALDVRQAAKLGETRVPKPKVYGRKKGAFSDITKMLSSGGMGYGQKPRVEEKNAGVAPDAQEMKATDDEDGDADAAPKLSDDQRRTALILSVKDRRPANARHFGRQDLLDFQKGFDRKTYMEFKRRMNTKLESVTQKIREKYERKKIEMDKAGFFPPCCQCYARRVSFSKRIAKALVA